MCIISNPLSDVHISIITSNDAVIRSIQGTNVSGFPCTEAGIQRKYAPCTEHCHPDEAQHYLLSEIQESSHSKDAEFKYGPAALECHDSFYNSSFISREILHTHFPSKLQDCLPCEHTKVYLRAGPSILCVRQQKEQKD